MNPKIKFASSANRFRIAPTCPCGKSNKDQKFSPENGNPHVGYCHSCCKTFFDNINKVDRFEIANLKESLPSYHSLEIMRKTLKNYEGNNFVKFCKFLFPGKDVERSARNYGIGSSNYYGGNSTIFWQRDRFGNIRAGKIMKYDSLTGKRLQNSSLFTNATWVHKVMKEHCYNLKQCLFGLHLLAGNKKPIAIVESEKTAFIMSLIDDTRLWLATGGKSNFKYDILKCLKGLQIKAYPDNGEFEIWKSKANALEKKGINIKVSRRLEKAENPNGWDLADEFIRKLHSTSNP